MLTSKNDGEFQSDSQTHQAGCLGPTGSPSTVNATSMHTQLPAGNYPRRKQNSTSGRKPLNCKTPEVPTLWKPSDMQRLDAHSNKCNRCGDTLHVKGFQCPARKFQCKTCHKFGHFTAVCYQKSQGQHSSRFIPIKETESPTTVMQGPYTPLMMLDSSDCESETEDTFCLQMKIHRTCISHPEVPKPVYLMANIAVSDYRNTIKETSTYGPD